MSGTKYILVPAKITNEINKKRLSEKIKDGSLTLLAT